MNQQLKAVLLTVLTLSCFVIALVELSGISKTAFFNKFNATESSEAAIKNTSYLPKTIIEFDSIHHNFGNIKEGEKVTHAFKFKNIGNKPLVISDARASCGCTVPSYPKEPIMPESGGEIVVEFNSDGRPGHQHKGVMVYSNAQEAAIQVTFDADVEKK
ncbi:MAG TPA: DUF1573 domain-containing protein [Flavipsychrobacter sp.]|nr:DUF1573 domain-containing protein [Flavipsychrobacter sp.]